ncbi:hypothetical protein ACIBKY_50985 [Nonomuraea sp. NPDC050394]|uniref:hypothetical protein n=1 Tax=Nonomuraea sp. NPDC050394 TaxID=3364363 RepID=UPI0037B020CE
MADISFAASPPLVFSDTSGVVTTAAFNVPAGATLVALCGSEIRDVTYTVTTNAVGAGLVWRKQLQNTDGNSGAAIVTTRAPAALTGLTVTLATGTDDAALKVLVARDVHPIHPVGKRFQGFGTVADYTPVCYTATKPGTWAAGVGVDYSGAGACSSSDVGEAYDAGSSMDGIAVRKSAAATGRDAVMSMNFATTAPNPQWSVAVVELMPDDGSTARHEVNTFDGGTNGATVSTANSGGTGNAFGNVVGQPRYTNAERLGGTGLSVVNPLPGTDTHLDWTNISLPGPLYGVRMYVHRVGVPSGFVGLFALLGSTGVVSKAYLMDDGRLHIYADAAATLVASTGVPLPSNAWARVELRYTIDAGAGAVEAWTYLDPHSADHDDYVIATGLTWPGGPPATVEFHLEGDATSSYYLDDLALGPDKVGPSVLPTRTGTRTARGALPAAHRAGSW